MTRCNKLSLLLSLVLALMGTGVKADTIEVPADQPTIQAGIDAAVDGDTVLVAPGIFTENIRFKGKKIVVTSHYAATQDTSFVRSTIIDGSNPANPDTASCVLFISGEDSTSVLQGFTLTGGTGTKWEDEHGGLTYVEGGGILVALCSPTIRNNIIVGNEAVRRPTGVSSSGGGGIRCGDGSPIIVNNIITGNSGLYGGGIVMNFTSGTIKNNVITNNVAYKAGVAPSYGGGGIWVNGSGTTTVIENNTIAGNSAQGSGNPPTGRGGGMVVWNTPVAARNNIVWGNTQVTGGQIFVIGTTPTVAYNDVEGGYDGEGNIDSDPLFEAGTYYLTVSSPCIDAGDTSALYNDPEDPANQGMALWPSLGALRNDMGAFGGPHRAVLGSVPTAIEGDEPGVSLPRAMALGQNFPNPFNPSTTISYSLAREADVALTIYSLRGKEMRTLVRGRMQAGLHTIHWDGRDREGRPAGSGIYLYRLTAGDDVLTRKMLLVK
jgi:hypothetical protein